MSILRHDMSMSLKRVGGTGDGGIDFLGWWWLPHEISNESGSPLLKRTRIRVIGQCKAEKKKIGPNYVRELEGVLYRFLTQKSDQEAILTDDMIISSHEETLTMRENPPPTVAVLVSQSAFTKSTILRANSSPIPFCLLHLPPLEEAGTELPIEQVSGELSGTLGSVWCNPALFGAKGLLRGRIEVRWERHLENGRAHPALWWDGVRLPSWVPDPISATTL